MSATGEQQSAWRLDPARKMWSSLSRKASFFFLGYGPSRLGADRIAGTGRPTKRQKRQHDNSRDQEPADGSRKHLPAGDPSSGTDNTLRPQDPHPTRTH